LVHIHNTFTTSQGENYESKLKPTNVEKTPSDDGEDADDDSQDMPEESSDANLDVLLRARESLLDILVERVHDVNYYTRANVLEVWLSLCNDGAIPVRRYGAVAELALDRLKDKTANVRRHAISLLVSLLDNNPFAGG
jgi:hypothetical protein